MLKASRMTLLTIGMLLSAASLADDAHSSDSDDAPLPEVTFNVDTLLAESRYAVRWQMNPPVEAIPGSDDWSQPIADFRFRRSGALARVSKLRSLSLLTLAEVGQVRLYLGVNEDGLVGLLFNDYLRDGDERYFEVARMPYLDDYDLDSEFE